MTFSSDCVDLVKQSEGCSLEAYQDAIGVWTVGWGHTPAQAGEHWTQAEADAQLMADIGKACEHAQDLVTAPLTQGQIDALTDFTFNMGAGNLKTSTLLRKLNAGLYDEVPSELMRWIYAGGKVLPGLVTRRQREVQLWGKA